MTQPPSLRADLPTEVYQQLRQIAQVRLANQPAHHTLQATALVHEAYLKLRSVEPVDRAHFYRLAAEAMRQILIDHARAKHTQKRGGGRRAMGDVAQLSENANAEEIVALDEAVSRLEQVERRSAEVVKLRFYAGLTVEETAAATGLSIRTVHREWDFARAWLFRALE